MKVVVVIGILSLLISCGAEQNGTNKTSGNKEPGQVVVTAQTPAQNGPIVATTATPVVPIVPVTTVGVTAVPDSYTFLDTPDANLCADAFIRQGITLPAGTVARTLNVLNVRQNGISVQDMGSSTVPVLTILRLDNRCSNTTFQLLNPLGFYCIVSNDANYSNVTIQRKCTAQLAEIEPATHVAVDSAIPAPVKHCLLFNLFFCSNDSGLEGTTTSYNSRIIETPCIP
jgi:hypothetical protein